ncbi:MAG TPA: hypothetical protein PKA61_01430 [Nitrospira sp.]|nr:hypothetical protein [Nitrospira sp.]
MLKISVQSDRGVRRMVLEGRLAGAWVAEARQAWGGFSTGPDSSRRVDLSAISHVDSAGRQLLEEMCRQGAELHATGCYTRSVLQEIVGSLESL